MTGKTCDVCGAELGGVHSGCHTCGLKLCSPRRGCDAAERHCQHTRDQVAAIGAARRYVRMIRTPAKRAYAESVCRAMLAGQPVPDAPAGLSVMAGQAVCMRLRELVTA